MGKDHMDISAISEGLGESVTFQTKACRPRYGFPRYWAARCCWKVMPA